LRNGKNSELGVIFCTILRSSKIYKINFLEIMKILVIGGGGREHAICWKLKSSPLVSELFCTPGNAGIAQIANCLEGDAIEIAKQIGADFVVVGPEVPLAEGIVDKLQEIGIAAFGPSKQAAQLEASKIFCKELLRKYHIPTARAAWFEDADAAREYLNHQEDGPIVLKADGLAAGKGVVVAANLREAQSAVDGLFALQAGSTPEGETPRLLIEECMAGDEVSLIALTDGETVLPLVAAQDHKRIGEGDTGANTGGMGCYSPVPAFTDELKNQALETILKPTIAAMKSEGIVYHGALYAGLMLTPQGPKVLEFNCRFGDPETQVILPRLKSDLLPLLMACAGAGSTPLAQTPCEWTQDAAVCVVLSAQNYPANDYRKGDTISGLQAAAQTGALVFHAGTKLRDDEIVTSGGRVLGVTALGENFLAARENCYRGVDEIQFEGAYFRRDIGWRCV
jgi:phosphoribosylamine--glycine ligase